MLDAVLVSAPTFVVPPLACDCHMHVFGNRAKYPLASFRSYSVGDAPLDAYLATQRRLGLSRIVFVQASGYHTDNRCMLDAIAAFGAGCRGVAVVAEDVADEELRRLHAAGVRAIRLNFVSVGSFTTRETASLFQHLSRRVAALGWHVQVFLHLDQLGEMAPLIEASPAPVVIDHMGLPEPGHDVDHADFAQLLDLVARGRCFVKLSGADRIARHDPDDRRATRFARALIETGPDQLVWGSDWPHIGWHDAHLANKTGEDLPFRAEDDGHLLNRMGQWADDPALRERILVTTPARLYDF